MIASSSNSGSTQPLSDILPWGSPVSSIGLGKTCPIPSAAFDGNDDDAASTETTSRTLLITDSLSADARFLLHTLALQFLSSKYDSTLDSGCHTSGSVLWISCGSPAATEKQIAVGLRKAMQHGLGVIGNDGNSSSNTSNLGSLNVVSVPLEMADVALNSDEDMDNNFASEQYLKRLHRRVTHWLKYRELLSDEMVIDKTKQQSYTQQQEDPRGPTLIIIDSITTIGSLFGDLLAQMFVSSVIASFKRFTKDVINDPETGIVVTNLLAIRCTSPDDGGLYNIADLNEFDDNYNAHRTKGQKLRSEYSRLLRPWLGAGSSSESVGHTFHLEEQSHSLSLQSQSTPSFLYKSGLYEYVDAVIDVSPLESGYARDVLGRLSFTTTWGGLGWWGINNSSTKKSANKQTSSEGVRYGSICVNYRCDDSGIRVMRLRSGK